MNELFSERNHLRKAVVMTSSIAPDMYRLLLDCCEKYIDNLAELYPARCPDGDDICGVDRAKLFRMLCMRIPNLRLNMFAQPPMPMVPDPYDSTHDQFAVLDYIEFIAANMKTINIRSCHSYYRHHHISLYDDNCDYERFRQEVNDIFSMTGLRYVLADQKQITRVTDAACILDVAKAELDLVPEQGLRRLIEEAIELHLGTKPEKYHLATEKIWDALERLKTVYVSEGVDKKKSTLRLIDRVSKGNAAFRRIFDEEFRTLTTIGNDYRIRHHETDKIDIDDGGYYDYFFNRCLSLIVLVIEKVF